MSDIELVIKIPKEDYERFRTYQDRGHVDGMISVNVIANGTPLPKGHGRLFDERDIVSGNYEVIGNKIYELEPIIEADKKDEEYANEWIGYSR